jgi:hypothetical protein
MPLHVSRSNPTSIPSDVFYDLQALNWKFPAKSTDEWLVSLIDNPDNETWELKLTSHGISRRCFFDGALGKHSSNAICECLIELRDAWER